MAGSITDKLDRVTDASNARPIITTLGGAGKGIGAASITVAAATNWTTTTAIHFSIYTTDSQGRKDATSQTDWKGTLSGSTISNLTLTGGTDRAYTAGAYVELTPTAGYAKDLYDWAVVGHNQDGTHKAFTEANIVSNSNIQDAAITPAKLIAGTGTSWTPASVTPTFTNLTVGNGTLVSSSLQTGPYVDVDMRLTLGTTSSVAGAISFTLPVAPHSSIQIGYYEIGRATISIGGTAYDESVCLTPADPTKAAFYHKITTGNYAVLQQSDGLSPASPTTGSVYLLHLRYRVL